MLDWGLGRYEETAAALEPAARQVVGLAGIVPGERVLDLGCGTGNAASYAAEAGAHVTGLDPAARLLEVARDRVPQATFVAGRAEELPFDDASFDVVLSVFALIFSPDPARAVSEALRVLAPGGRAYVSAWIPRGAVDAMISAYMRALPPRGERFRWDDADAVRALAPAASVEVHEGAVVFEAASPEAYVAAQSDHPMSVSMLPLLEGAGVADRVAADALAALREHNEDPAAFRATAPYVVYELRP